MDTARCATISRPAARCHQRSEPATDGWNQAPAPTRAARSATARLIFAICSTRLRAAKGSCRAHPCAHPAFILQCCFTGHRPPGVDSLETRRERLPAWVLEPWEFACISPNGRKRSSISSANTSTGPVTRRASRRSASASDSPRSPPCTNTCRTSSIKASCGRPGTAAVRSRWCASEQTANGIEIPLLGRVAAGRPIEAVATADVISVPRDMVGRRECFALRVSGDSMIDDHIMDGDFVVLESRKLATRRRDGRGAGAGGRVHAEALLPGRREDPAGARQRAHVADGVPGGRHPRCRRVVVSGCWRRFARALVSPDARDGLLGVGTATPARCRPTHGHNYGLEVTVSRTGRPGDGHGDRPEGA